MTINASLACVAILLSLVDALCGQTIKNGPEDKAARECHQLLTGFRQRDMTHENGVAILESLRKINDCARGSYMELTKRDLSFAESLSYSLGFTIMTNLEQANRQLGADN